MVSCFQHILDFANLFKAFIGSNYLSMPFAFSQSGLILGIIFLIFIALITDHCCSLIIRNKQLIIEELVEKYRDNISGTEDGYESDHSNNSINDTNESTDDERNYSDYLYNVTIRKLIIRLNKCLSMGDIGHYVFGTVGLVCVNFCLFFTQFGFCIGYFIFLGNTIFECFPVYNVTVEADANSSYYVFNNIRENKKLDKDAVEVLNYNADLNTTDILPWHLVKFAPNLMLLVMIPFPIFLIFSLIRSIRKMGCVSVVANISICIGIISVLFYLLLDFKLSPDSVMYKLNTLPVYFGLLSGAFEGIGTVIPIEASMVNNKHNFRCFLRLAVFLLTVILAVFGITGYLSFGSSTQQILVQNLPQNSYFTFFIDITLMIGVVFTFPLQIYPVIEMVERFLFSQKEEERSVSDPLLAPKSSDFISLNVPQGVPDSVSAWKRNLVRITLVSIQLGIAVLMRDNFAYLSSFIGALGSCFLAYILPCAVHLKLTWSKTGCVSIMSKLKDVFILLFGIFASVTSLYVTIKKFAEQF